VKTKKKKGQLQGEKREVEMSRGKEKSRRKQKKQGSGKKEILKTGTERQK
jgi:hypothetical protein